MADHVHSTPASTVHDIPPGTPPGGTPAFEPVAEMPDPFTSLGDAAASVAASLAAAVGQGPGSGANPVLRALVEEFEAKLTEESALRAAAPRVDCDKVPGWLTPQHRLDEITSAMYEIRPESIADVLLASRFLLFPWIQDDQEAAVDLGHNLAEDLLRLYGGGAVQPASAEVAA